MAGLYRVEVQNDQLVVLLNAAKLDRLHLSQLSQLGLAIRDSAARVQARAVRNVSGVPVQYDGNVFRVQTRTGALKGSIEMQYPYQGVWQARVFVNGAYTAAPVQMGDMLVKARPVSEYAAAIEYGHAEIDLKKTMMGKVVPFFASRSANSTGPYSARGLTQVPDSDRWENKPLNNRLAAMGKGPMHFQRKRTIAAYEGAQSGGGSYYIAFRRVGKTGWVIPAAKQRPFMRAALRQSERDTRHYVHQRLRAMLADATATRKPR